MAYKPRYYDPLIEDLYTTILKLESIEDCMRFFDDLCTINELQSFSQRLKVAKLLDANETYASIELKTGASTATISRISRFLKGASGGYKMLLDKEKK